MNRGRILVVDDEAVVRDFLARYLKGKGFTVATAATGEEGVDLARKERPHIVLMDIRMPGKGGIEALKEIRKFDSSIAVMMITANQDLALARESMTLGACDYSSKPFDLMYLDTSVMTQLLFLTE